MFSTISQALRYLRELILYLRTHLSGLRGYALRIAAAVVAAQVAVVAVLIALTELRKRRGPPPEDFRGRVSPR